ncbi:MAG: DUF6069 family protein [Saprospiraceae bacterium]
MSAKTIATRGLRGIGIAVVINVILLLIFNATNIIPKDFIVPQANQPITILPVIMATIIPLSIATLLYALLARFTKNPNRIFWIIAIGMLIFTLYPPFTIPNVPLSMAIGLNVMHVVAALSIAWSLTRP